MTEDVEDEFLGAGAVSDDGADPEDVGFREDDVRHLQRSLPETTNLRAALQKLTSDHVDLVGEFVDGFDSPTGSTRAASSSAGDSARRSTPSGNSRGCGWRIGRSRGWTCRFS